MPWSLLLDLLLALMMVGFLVQGYRAGLLKTVVSFVTYLASFVGAMLFSRLLSEEVATVFRPGLYDLALEQINRSAAQTSEATVDQILKAFPALLSGVLNLSGIDGQLQQTIESAYAKGAPALAAVVVDEILLPVVAVNLQILFFALLFMLFLILARRVSGMMQTANHIPILGLFNRLGGAFIGLLKGVLFALLVTIVLGFLVPLTENGAEIFQNTLLMDPFFQWFSLR